MHYPVAWTVDSPKDNPTVDDSITWLDTWKAMEAMVEKGLVKQIGVSNFIPSEMKELNAAATIKPVVNQMEFHPCVLGGRELLKCAETEGIVLCKYYICSVVRVLSCVR